MAGFAWDKIREEAAHLIAAGELEDGQIAAQCGVVRQTLWNWRQHPDFAARIEEVREQIRQALLKRAIGNPERRVARLNREWLRLQRVLDERAADPSMAKVPGGTTGLVVRKMKMIGSGDNAMPVDEFEVDTGTLAELRQIEKQAAQELGQWTERSTVEDARKSYETTNTPDAL